MFLCPRIAQNLTNLEKKASEFSIDRHTTIDWSSGRHPITLKNVPAPPLLQHFSTQAEEQNADEKKWEEKVNIYFRFCLKHHWTDVAWHKNVFQNCLVAGKQQNTSDKL